MATARLVISTALRQLGVLGAGREARTPDAADALAALQGLYFTWIDGGAFGRMADVIPTGSTYTAQGNERIVRQSAEMALTLPSLVSDCEFSDYGHERRGYYGTKITITDAPDGSVVVDVEPGQPLGYVTTPRDGAPIVVTDETAGTLAAWIYSGTRKLWERIDRLQLDSDAPRSMDHAGLAACLALEIAAQFGSEVQPAVIRQAARYQVAMTHRYGMRTEHVAGVYC